ncbi:MAG: cytochrome c-type biogenesis protein CcmH [Betaproteobacteria bacterium]|nr:cytochrome c-type biogenesis protein CcmH [Betaproteobacteria bacterium]
MTPRLLVRLTLALALAAGAAFAQQSAPDVAFEARLKRLEADLRCLVCQNQTLADSNAPLAEDLRREVRTLALSGKSDAEIRTFLVARYGDFVLYDPPVKESTWLLWFGPFLLLGGGVVAWLAIVRRRRRQDASTDAGTPATSADAAARARALLDEKSSG